MAGNGSSEFKPAQNFSSRAESRSRLTPRWAQATRRATLLSILVHPCRLLCMSKAKQNPHGSRFRHTITKPKGIVVKSDCHAYKSTSKLWNFTSRQSMVLTRLLFFRSKLKSKSWMRQRINSFWLLILACPVQSHLFCPVTKWNLHDLYVLLKIILNPTLIFWCTLSWVPVLKTCSKEHFQKNRKFKEILENISKVFLISKYKYQYQ